MTPLPRQSGFTPARRRAIEAMANVHPRLDVRISLGSGSPGMYLVFRGDPADTIELLEVALDLARQELPAGRYQDRRGRPQG